MKEFPFMNLSPVYVEISHSSLKALRENEGIEIPLERSAGGQLTAATREKITSALLNLVQRKPWQPRVRAICAIGANGVTLRRMALPMASREELPKLLRLQIETEFPLPPDELAWGYRTLGQISATTGPAKQEVLVAAVKKDRIEEYASILFAAGLNPIFTLAALARSSFCPQPPGSCGLLDIGQKHSELVSFDNSVPISIRVFPWGAENDDRSAAGLDALAKFLSSQPAGNKIYVTSTNSELANQLTELRSRLVNGVQLDQLKSTAGPGRSTAILGLKKSTEENAAPPLLLLQTALKPTRVGNFRLTQPVPKKWALRIAALLCVLLLLPYAEALLLKGHLAKKLTAIKTGQKKLDAIDSEFVFLSYLKQNQPPYLDALYLFAKAAPPGARLDSTSMNRRGEIVLRGSLHDSQQVTDFRSKLIDSGFFERVTVEEQLPTPDRQKVNVRITAQWKPFEGRVSLAVGPTPDEIQKAKTNKTAQASGGRGGPFPGMME